MVDKVDVKEYVADKIGREYIIPTLGTWNSQDDIDFNLLPDKFVIKCNHNSGQGLYICTDKKKMDEEKVREGLRRALKEDYYLICREWPYKNVKRRIIAEYYLEDPSSDDGDLKDYKFMCFNGEVKCVFVCTERKKKLKVTFFDRDWNRLPFERHYPQSEKLIPQPTKYEKMLKLAEVLSKDIPFVRVDFYEVNGHVYFGELTFFPGAGFEEFNPKEWDNILGSWINIERL
ncbi:MAG: glycosyl transferase [Muribaculum sp.]|nr:glycosyl transferase [Muribaculum sp.]